MSTVVYTIKSLSDLRKGDSIYVSFVQTRVMKKKFRSLYRCLVMKINCIMTFKIGDFIPFFLFSVCLILRWRSTIPIDTSYRLFQILFWRWFHSSRSNFLHSSCRVLVDVKIYDSYLSTFGFNFYGIVNVSEVSFTFRIQSILVSFVRVLDMWLLMFCDYFLQLPLNLFTFLYDTST